MKISDIEPGGVYMGLGRQLREVIKFSETGNRLLFRALTDEKQTYTGKIRKQAGTVQWVTLQSFANWACEVVA